MAFAALVAFFIFAYFLHLLNRLYSDLSFLILLFLFLPLPWEEA